MARLAGAIFFILLALFSLGFLFAMTSAPGSLLYELIIETIGKNPAQLGNGGWIAGFLLFWIGVVGTTACASPDKS